MPHRYSAAGKRAGARRRVASTSRTNAINKALGNKVVAPPQAYIGISKTGRWQQRRRVAANARKTGLAVQKGRKSVLPGRGPVAQISKAVKSRGPVIQKATKKRVTKIRKQQTRGHDSGGPY